ncbi:hypothetical protein BGX33_004722 [Mortierella sp. NVP41]|nr:hypothetical protein BGX33_004722 [Mortierella sp. NVP41]
MTIPTWIIRFVLCLWLATTMRGANNLPGYICDITMDLQMSAIMQYLKIATEIIIVVFFLERVLSLHRSSSGIIAADSHHHHWRRLALINAGITFLVVLFEILVGQITVYLTDYLFLTYSMVNLIQATLCVFIVEDTKSVFKERAAAAQNNSNSHNTLSNHGSGGSGGARHSTLVGPMSVSGRHDDREDESVVSYADAIAAARAARLSQDSQKPWSLTMRPSGSDMPSSPIQIHQAPRSNLYYDGMETPDHKKATTTIPQRWRTEAEDEIPMTRTKASQDGGAYY